jgi:hypothetical protein
MDPSLLLISEKRCVRALERLIPTFRVPATLKPMQVINADTIIGASWRSGFMPKINRIMDSIDSPVPWYFYINALSQREVTELLLGFNKPVSPDSPTILVNSDLAYFGESPLGCDFQTITGLLTDDMALTWPYSDDVILLFPEDAQVFFYHHEGYCGYVRCSHLPE